VRDLEHPEELNRNARRLLKHHLRRREREKGHYPFLEGTKSALQRIIMMISKNKLPLK